MATDHQPMDRSTGTDRSTLIYQPIDRSGRPAAWSVGRPAGQMVAGELMCFAPTTRPISTKVPRDLATAGLRSVAGQAIKGTMNSFLGSARRVCVCVSACACVLLGRARQRCSGQSPATVFWAVPDKL